MPLFTSLLIVLIVARFAGEVAERLGKPAMVGEILAGVVLGPSLLNLVPVTEELRTVADLGVFLLVLLAGMEMEVSRLAEASRGRGAWVPALGFLTPLSLGMVVGALFGYDATRVLFLGLCLAITALPVSVRILMDLGRLQSQTGQLIVSLASWGLAVAVLATGFAGKLRGGYAGARAAGLASRDRWIVAFGLNGRGVMDLVIATIALENGFIEPPLFSILVLTAIVGAVLTPILLGRAYGEPEVATPQAAPASSQL